jgi:membrane-associated phospholipid phosphatase
VALVVSFHVRNRLVRAVAWIVAVAASALVGFSRMYRGMHHLSDVIVGALLGTAVLVVSIAVVRVVSAAVDARRTARLDDAREVVMGLALGDAAGDTP